MGEHSAIGWTDHTFNPWWGCARVSAACRTCYAEALATRFGHDVWGERAGRRFFGDKHWAEPLQWNAAARADGRRRRVFCASMADVFEARPDLDEPRERLWQLIDDTPWLDWQLLTKRPQNIASMIPAGWVSHLPGNVWLGTTVEDQSAAEARIPYLAALPAVVRFLSCEPMLEPLDLDLDGIGWVIIGSESGYRPRPTELAWVRDLVDCCIAADAAVFVKQLPNQLQPRTPHTDIRRFPVDLRIRHFPTPDLAAIA